MDVNQRLVFSDHTNPHTMVKRWSQFLHLGDEFLNGSTPLFPAITEGQLNVVRWLLAARADPTLRNRQGLTALESARAAFGGTAPTLVEQALSQTPAHNQMEV